MSQPDPSFEQRLSTEIAHHAADAIVAIDQSQKIIYFNDRAEELFGYDQAEILGEQLDTLIPERHRAAHPEHVRNFAASPVLEYRLGHQRPVPGLRRDGSEFIAEIAFSKLLVDGELVMVAMLHDVTVRIEQDQFREFLVESNRVLTAGLEFGERAERMARLIVPRYADWCLIDLLVNGTVKRAAVAHHDPAAEERLRALPEFVPDAERQDEVAQVLRRGEPILVPVVTDTWLREVSHRDALYARLREFAPESLMILPLTTGGRTLGALTAAYSGSGRSYTSDDLKIGMEFAGLAALQINNSRLYREALESSRIRDEVLRIVAHDLRNPLHTISLSAGLLRDLGELEPGSAGENAVEVIERAVARANSLIQDLLEVSRIGQGVLGLEPGPTTVASLVETVLDQHRALAEEKSITLESDLTGDLPEVLADRDRIYQALENLIGNALKFTGPGGKVTVGAEARPNEVVFHVTDTGQGIPRSDIPRLFDPFWQAARTGRSGAGLGLAIARGIIEAHQGRIWVESEVGVGSTFYFTLPVVEKDRR